MPARVILLRAYHYLAVFLLAAFLLCPASAKADQSSRTGVLKIALLPIPDVLPFHVARELGLFDRAGVQVEAVPVSSPLDRDQLMQAGQIDGMLTELTTTAYFNRSGTSVKIVAVARRPLEGHALFRILSAPGSNLKQPGDLAGVPIGVSMHTVIEYVTDRLLASQGVYNIDMKSVPVIPERFQLLMQGQLKAATLPEPLASSALSAGATQVVSDAANPDYSISVLSFSKKALSSSPDKIRAFLKAWDQAAARLNSEPESYYAIMRKTIRLPPNVQKTFKIPVFPRKEVPGPDRWKDVMDWMIAKKLLEEPVPYNSSVTGEFLPR